MRFRTELLPILPVVLAASATTIPIQGCKKEKATTVIDAGAGKPPIIIRNHDDIPPVMGGAVAPSFDPKPVVPSASSGPVGARQPSQGPQAAAPAAAAAAADPPEAQGRSGAIAITHNHPPDQPCQPLKREEVEKALSDLQKKPQ